MDHVFVFTGIAGGAKKRLVAATPLLMLLQIVLLPVFLLLFAGSGSGAACPITVGPFVDEVLFLITLVCEGQAAEFPTMSPHSIHAYEGAAEIFTIFDHDGERAHLPGHRRSPRDREIAAVQVESTDVGR